MPATPGPRATMNAEPVPAALDALAGEYEILRELGRGGTAVVYLARHRETGDEVAIKLVRDQFSRDEEAVARLAREARFVARLHHPNVVPVRDVLDFGEAGVALVMTHVPGHTLRQILRDEGALAPDRVSRILRDLALALDAAHAVGIVHRDVKPENVFITDEGRAVLADFGIARSMSSEAQQLTMHGVAIGTPAYMAPEQLRGERVSPATDLFAVGVLLFEMLTGRHPFAAPSMLELQTNILRCEPASLSLQRLSLADGRLDQVIGRALAKDPRARFRNAHAMQQALLDILPPMADESEPASSQTPF